MWPFSKKPPRLSPETERIFENLYRFFKDDAEQISQYPDQLKERIRSGLNLDSIPGATGSFGTTITNPIPVNGPIGEILYLSSLRFGEQRVLFHRLRSFEVTDVYECVSERGDQWDVLFLDMYHPRKSTLAPNRYSIVPNFLLSGVSAEVSDFPSQLYEAIVSYSERRFGMSLADPAIRLRKERTRYNRPLDHLERISRLKQGQLGVSREELIQRIINETVSSQTSMHDQLAKFSEGGLRRGDIRTAELVYFALSLTVYSIFRWSRKHPKSEIADKVSLNVLKMNVDSIDNGPRMSELVGQYQRRSESYKSALLLMGDADSWKRNEFELASLISRNVLGKENPIIGILLCGTAAVILAAMKGLLEELELG
jgi:hypothetical protein